MVSINAVRHFAESYCNAQSLVESLHEEDLFATIRQAVQCADGLQYIEAARVVIATLDCHTMGIAACQVSACGNIDTELRPVELCDTEV